MDFSFLNAMYRTTTLPPPEPWFAGSALHYTYFGHFLVAAMGKAAAIAPEIMFNLGIGLVAALLAAATLAAGTLIGGRLATGSAAVALCMLVGNLSAVRELLAAPQRRLRLLLGDVQGHPEHHQRVPVVEPGLRGSPRPRPGDALGPHPGRRARPRSGTLPTRVAGAGAALGARRCRPGRDHDHQRLEHANLPGAGDLAGAGGLARRDRARPQPAGVARGRMVPPGAADGGGSGRRVPAHPAVLAPLPASAPLLGLGGRPVRQAPRRPDRLRAGVGDRRARRAAPVVARPGGRAHVTVAGRPGGRARAGAAAGGHEPAGAGDGSPSSGQLGGTPGRRAAARSAGGPAGGVGSVPAAAGPGDHGNGHGPGVRDGLRVGPHEHHLQVLPGRLAAAGGRGRRSGGRWCSRSADGRAAVAARRRHGSRRGRLRRDQRRLGRGDAPAHPAGRAGLSTAWPTWPSDPRTRRRHSTGSTGTSPEHRCWSRRPGPPTRSSAGSA